MSVGYLGLSHSPIPDRSNGAKARAVRRAALARSRSRRVWEPRCMPKTRATVEDDASTRAAAAMCERPASFHGLPATGSRGNGGATS
jgi:hypothetical protein